MCIKVLRLVTVQLPEKSSPSDRDSTELLVKRRGILGYPAGLVAVSRV
jgi:hypothetical protein